MITLKEIEQTNGEIKISRGEWGKVANILDENGYKWRDGSRYTEKNAFSHLSLKNMFVYVNIKLGGWTDNYDAIKTECPIYLVSTVKEFNESPEKRLFKAIFGNEPNKSSNPGVGQHTEGICGDSTPTCGLEKLLIDPDNKLCVFLFRGKKYVIRCHKDDRFDWRVAVGIMYSRYRKNDKSLNYLRRIMREKQYYVYCYKLLFDFDTTLIDKAVDDYENHYKQLHIDEQVRQSECEIRKIKYEPKKIVRELKEVNL